MITADSFMQYAQAVFEQTGNAAARYKIAARYLNIPYESAEACALREDFLSSDAIRQLEDEQYYDGGWGPLRDKDYSEKAVFPTTFAALERCLYLGLTLADDCILPDALDYLSRYLDGVPPAPLYNKNERAIPWQMYEIAAWAERIHPRYPLCDDQWNLWMYIADRAFSTGEYDYERDAKAQHEALFTREKRLVPLPIGLLMLRHEDLPNGLAAAMLRHFGGQAYDRGFFWDKGLAVLPQEFVGKKTRRYFHTAKYINQFPNNDFYLTGFVKWLIQNRRDDGFWYYGSQTNDPWGYFQSFSVHQRTESIRVLDCTMEVLDVLHRYMEANSP